MKFSLGRVMAYLIGGGIGAFLGYLLAIYFLILFVIGPEGEGPLPHPSSFVVGLLIVIGSLFICLCAGAGAWLLASWIYPRRQSSAAEVQKECGPDVWPPPI